jgi:Tuberculosis necrotizing toxin
MRCRSFIISALTALIMSVILPVSAKADVCPPAISPADGPVSAPYKVPPNLPAYPADVLGPDTLPGGPVGKTLVGYSRLGLPPMDAKGFLAAFYTAGSKNPDTGKPTGDWKWPDYNGFDGKPEAYSMQPGEVVDRFGSIYGTFVANERGTSFAARGLPPSSLNTYEGQPAGNYHAYCVLKPLKIQRGKIAPAFGQPGGGIQYYLGNGRVTDLITGGTLREVVP